MPSHLWAQLFLSCCSQRGGVWALRHNRLHGESHLPVSRLLGGTPATQPPPLGYPHVCVCARLWAGTSTPVCVQLTTALFPVPGAKERTLHSHLWALGPGHFYLDEGHPLQTLRGQRSQAGCRPEARTESDTTEADEHMPITEPWSPSCCEMDSTNGVTFPVSAAHLSHLWFCWGSQNRPSTPGTLTSWGSRHVSGAVFGQVPSPGTLPKLCTPFPRCRDRVPPSSVLPLSLSLSLPVPASDGCSGRLWGSFWFLLPPVWSCPLLHDTLLAGGSGQVAWVCDGQAGWPEAP